MRLIALVLGVSLVGCHFVLDPNAYTDDPSDGGGAASADAPLVDAPLVDAGTSMLRVSVETGAEDALQDPGGAMRIAYAWISLYSDSHWGALRFLIPDIPRGATIVEAHLELLIDSDAEDDPDLVLYVEPTPNPVALSMDPFDISNRVRSVASVMWVEASIGAGVVQSPPVNSLVQEAVDHSSWTAGSYIMFIFDAQPSSNFEFWQWENGNGASPAELVIRYTAN